MRIFEKLRKTLRTYRKIIWLFLCGMLVVSKVGVAQQPTRNDGDLPGTGSSNPPPEVKYGPPPGFTDRTLNEPPAKSDETTKLLEERERMRLNDQMVLKYGPESSFKPRIAEKPSNPKQDHVKKRHHKPKKHHVKAHTDNHGEKEK